MNWNNYFFNLLKKFNKKLFLINNIKKELKFFLKNNINILAKNALLSIIFINK